MTSSILFSGFALKVYLLAFLIGAIPFGLLVSAFLGHHDLQSKGSGNTGATNVVRVVGKKAGILVFVLDFLKGLLPVVATGLTLGPTAGMIVGALTVTGHCFSPYLKFNGGKGVATTVGVISAFAPWVVLLCLPVFIGVYKSVRAVSLASLASVGFAVILLILLHAPTHLTFLGTYLFIVVLTRHRENLDRILRHEELQF